MPAPVIPILISIGGTVVRALGPRVAQQLLKQGGKRVAKEGSKKIKPSTTVSTVAQAKKFKAIPGAGKMIPRTRPSVKGTRPALKGQTKVLKPPTAKMPPAAKAPPSGGPTLSKPKTGPGRAAVKTKTPKVRPDRKPVKPKTPPLKGTRKVNPTRKVSPTVSGSRGARTSAGPRVRTRRSSVPTGGRTGMTRGSTARLTPAQRLAIMGGAGAAAVSMMPKSDMPKSKAAPKMAMPKPKPPVQGPPRPPKKVSPGPVGPVKRGGAQKNITKGPNTGFGIKGNQFVGGPEERAIMMKYYGGTGSAAAKAAMEGKQGILKSKGMAALRKELAEARKKRLSRETKRNEGGQITPAEYKGFSKLPEKVQKKMSPTLAEKYAVGGKISKKLKSNKPMKPKKTGVSKKPNKNIGAGPNVGFGPKGNIFPSDSKERKDLMKMYGGTGSKAGSSTKFKKGGKVSKSKSEVVARQQRGWGAARKPKK